MFRVLVVLVCRPLAKSVSSQYFSMLDGTSQPKQTALNTKI
jgi:hypothetical protein